MKPLPDCKYRITPSILNSFHRYLNPDYEGFWWQDEAGGWHTNYNEDTGEYHFTPSKVDDMALKEFIDTLNRVESISEAACKGTALNEVVDWAVSGVKPNAEKVVTDSSRSEDKLSVAIKKSRDDDGPFLDDNVFRFNFSRSWVASIAEYFKGSLCQVEVHAPLDTKYGRTELYGYIDYWNANRVYDLKTTKRYTFGDHSHGWQKHVYPYCLVKSGMIDEIQDFEYTIYKWTGGTRYQPLLAGEQYKEVYTFDYGYSEMMLRKQCERLIEFLEEHRDEITDLKIFGGEYHSEEDRIKAEMKAKQLAL